MDIELIFHNDFGTGFFWIDSDKINAEQIQLVFRETGLLLDKMQLKQFNTIIDNALQNFSGCKCCMANKDSRTLLLETPLQELSFAVTYHELVLASELVSGVLFQLEMNEILKKENIRKNL